MGQKDPRLTETTTYIKISMQLKKIIQACILVIKVALIIFATLLIAQFINQCYNPYGMHPARKAKARATVNK